MVVSDMNHCNISCDNGHDPVIVSSSLSDISLDSGIQLISLSNGSKL